MIKYQREIWNCCLTWIHEGEFSACADVPTRRHSLALLCAKHPQPPHNRHKHNLSAKATGYK